MLLIKMQLGNISRNLTSLSSKVQTYDCELLISMINYCIWKKKLFSMKTLKNKFWCILLAIQGDQWCLDLSEWGGQAKWSENWAIF